MRVSGVVGLPLLAVLCTLLFVFPAQSGELSRATMLSIHCAGCHGTDGVSPGSIPSISCKSPAEFKKVLAEYRDGKRFSTIMGRHIKGYTDEEIQLMASFFCKKK